MKRVDLINMEEFSTVAEGQMEMCDDILKSEGTHPADEDAPSKERLVLALRVAAVMDALDLLLRDIEVEMATTDEPRPYDFEYRQGRIYNRSDGFTYWYEGGDWRGTFTLSDDTLQFPDGVAVEEFGDGEEAFESLVDALEAFWREKAFGDYSPH